MPPPGPYKGRYSFGAPAAAPAGALLYAPRARLTSRTTNDAVIRTAPPPRVRPRPLMAADIFAGYQRAGMSFITAYGEFSAGTLEGLADSLKGAWQLVSHDLWKLDTYREMGTTLLALNLLDPFHLSNSMAAAQAFDKRWGTHVAQRQIDIMAAINQLVHDVPRWTPRQWGHAVGRLLGDILLAKGAGAAAKVGLQAGLRVAATETIHLRTISTQLQTLSKVSAGASRVAKARAILPVYARFTMVRTTIPFLDVGTGLNKASFWSGLEGSAKEAQALARASGRTTLETTRGGAWLDRQSALLGKQLDWQSQLRPQWGRLSSRFAAKARGTVEMYRGPRYAGSGSVWEQFERTPLEAGQRAGRVTDIRIIDVPKK